MNGHGESDASYDDIIMKVGKEVELGDSLQINDNNNRDSCLPTE